MAKRQIGSAALGSYHGGVTIQVKRPQLTPWLVVYALAHYQETQLRRLEHIKRGQWGRRAITLVRRSVVAQLDELTGVRLDARVGGGLGECSQNHEAGDGAGKRQGARAHRTQAPPQSPQCQPAGIDGRNCP